MQVTMEYTDEKFIEDYNALYQAALNADDTPTLSFMIEEFSRFRCIVNNNSVYYKISDFMSLQYGALCRTNFTGFCKIRLLQDIESYIIKFNVNVKPFCIEIQNAMIIS